MKSVKSQHALQQIVSGDLCRLLSRALVAVVVTSMMFSAATPLNAQRTGTRIGRDANVKDGVTALRLIAECYNDRAPKSVRKWLETLPGAPSESEIVSRDAENLSSCLDSNKVVFDGKEVSFKARTLRRAVGAEMARKLLLTNTDVLAPAADAKLWFYEQMAKLPTDAHVDRSSLASQEFGHCVALAKWDDSRRLLLSQDDSTEEWQAVQNMIPALGPCLITGSTITITKRNLREIIGEPVYHLLLASEGSGKR